MKIEKVNRQLLNILEKEKRIDLDFLGYGVSECVELRQLAGKPVYLTTLDKERLDKMLAFRKSEYGIKSLDEMKGEVREVVTCLAKSQSAML